MSPGKNKDTRNYFHVSLSFCFLYLSFFPNTEKCTYRLG